MGWSILVADDDPMIRSLLRIMLETANHTVFEAQNGQDAIKKVHEIHPDAMILNIRMPEMDGYSVCHELRHNKETAVLPILILSGQAHLTAVNKGLLAGANRYLTKPMSRTILLQNLDEVLNEQANNFPN
ncbi:MAG: response regulator [Ardenticatenaceae bacterium]|nr:response regulator [Ardenticatenaceae bacterium]